MLTTAYSRAVLLVLCWPILLSGADGAVKPPRVLDDRLALELFAKDPDIVTPVSIDVDTKGRLWVVESNTHFTPKGYTRHPSDRILIISDESGDGRADRFHVFTDGLAQVMGLQLLDDRRVLIATRREIYLYSDPDGDGSKPERVSLARLETKGNYPHNGLCGFAVDDLGVIHFGFGENLGVSYRLVGADGTTLSGGAEGGSMFLVRQDGTGLRRVSTGFWNPFHHCFDAFGNLFVVDNDPDSRPPCRLIHAPLGGDFGYRFFLGRAALHPFQSWNGRLPATLPMTAGTGEAPSGMLWYESGALPAEYDGTLLVTSWGDHRIERYRLRPRGASFVSHTEPIIAGGDDFRPVGIATAPDGSVYFTDWVDKSYPVHGRGRIWRLRAKVAPEPGSERKTRRNPSRVRYREVLQAAKERRLSVGTIRELVESKASDDTLAASVRLLVDSASVSGAALAPLIAAGLLDTHPRALMEALLRTGSLAGIDARVVEIASSSDDPYLRSAALDALARLSVSDSLRSLARSEDAGARLVSLLAMRRRGGVGKSPSPFFEVRQTVTPKDVAGFLTDADAGVRRAALQWVGEEKISELGGVVDKALDVGEVTRDLFDAFVSTQALLRGENAKDRDRSTRDAYLVKLVGDRRHDGGFRALAIRSISRAHRWNRKRLEKLLGDTDDRVRLETVRSLADSRVGGARELLASVARREGEKPSLRWEAVMGLSAFAVASDDARRELVTLLDSPDEGVAREAARALRGVDVDETVATRLRTLDPGTRNPEDPQAVLANARLLTDGDPAAGERLFFHPRGPRCSSCHTINGRGGAAGPDLSRVGRVGRQKILESIVAPSREIAPRFTTWLYITKSAAHTGISLGAGPDGKPRLATADGRIVTVPRAEVVESRVVTTSLMPEKLAATMTRRELSDLLTYLESLR